MKKFILGSAFAASLALGATYSYSSSHTGLCNLQMDNIEALSCEECGVDISAWCAQADDNACTIIKDSIRYEHSGYAFVR